MTEISELKSWNAHAEEDYSAAKSLLALRKPLLGAVCFHAQQCVDASIFAWPVREIKKLNQIAIEVYFAGVLVYLGAILAVWALPWGEFLLTNDNLFTRLWVFPIAVIVIGYFLVLQFFIHRLLSMSKAIRLEKIDRKLEGLSPDDKNDTSFDMKLRLMNELISWRKIVEAEPEWPLNVQTSIGVIGTVLIPTLASISDFFTRFFGK